MMSYFFFKNNSLKDLLKLNFFPNNIEDLSLFKENNMDKINSIYLEEKIIKKGFEYLSTFKNIKIKILNINAYIFTAEFENPYLQPAFEDKNFFYDKILENPEKLTILKSLFSTDGNSNDFFSYIKLKNETFPFLKNNFVKKIDIYYEKDKNKYKCNLFFGFPDLELNLFFDDLSFLKNSHIVNYKQIISLFNVNIDNNFDMKIFENLKISHLNLDNIHIENNDFLSFVISKLDVIKFKNLTGNLNLMKKEKKELFEMKICYDKNNNLIQCIFNKPFDFNIILNKKELTELKSFYSSTSIDLSYLNLNDDDINFLNNEILSSLKTLDLSNTGISSLNFISFKSLVNLESINLSNNKIEDISPLTIENIAFLEQSQLRRL